MRETREITLNIFKSYHLPLAEFELRQRLAKKGLKLNKTSVYRLLEKLADENLIKSVDFGDRKKRYELNLHNHHHHLICTNCNIVEDIFVHNDVKHVEEKIRKEKKFIIKTHQLEFFGLCKECSWKQ